jgi:hypothetical protein
MGGEALGEIDQGRQLRDGKGAGGGKNEAATGGHERTKLLQR